MGPHGGLSGVATPDLGWQQSGRRGRAAAARISTSAETPADTQASPRHGSPHDVSASSAQSGLPTPAQYDPYTAPDSYTEPGPPNPLQEQMAAQLTALTVQIAALAAALMAGQRNSAAEVRTPSPRPSPPWTATTLPAAPAAPPAPPAPAPPPPPTPAAPPPPTPAAQPTPTPPAAEPLYELSAPDFGLTPRVNLDGVKLLQVQLRLLLDKLPDSQPDKMELIRKALQDESQGVMPWSSKHDMLDAIAIWLAPSHELSLTRAAPVANAAATPGMFGFRPPKQGCWICASITCSSLTCPLR